MEAITVLIVDDHTIFRQGLRKLLESFPDIKVVGEASHGKQAIYEAERLKPSIVLMDIKMPGMDGIEELKGVIVLAASNRPDLIDPALLRAGRFDLHIELPLPDGRARLEIFQIHTRGKPLAGDVNLEELSEKTEGLTGADIEAICRRASMLAIREFINKDVNEFCIRAEHFEEALKSLE